MNSGNGRFQQWEKAFVEYDEAALCLAAFCRRRLSEARHRSESRGPLRGSPGVARCCGRTVGRLGSYASSRGPLLPPTSPRRRRTKSVGAVHRVTILAATRAPVASDRLTQLWRCPVSGHERPPSNFRLLLEDDCQDRSHLRQRRQPECGYGRLRGVHTTAIPHARSFPSVCVSAVWL